LRLHAGIGQPLYAISNQGFAAIGTPSAWLRTSDGAQCRDAGELTGGKRMKRLLAITVITLLFSSPAAASIVFSYQQSGSTIPTNCPPGFPAQPLCSIIDATGVANDTPDSIPGQWSVTLHGQVLFFEGTGTFLFDDGSAADNDFFGTWTNVLLPPDASGIAHSIFEWTVTGGTGLFAGMTGFGASMGDVVIAPAGFDPQGNPIFVAACPGAQPGIGSYCDQGQFTLKVPEPGTALLLTAALLGGFWRRRPR
jgi:hypothetical protein